MVHAKDPQQHERHERRDDETEVDHGVGRKDEELLLTLLGDIGVFGIFRAGDRARWVPERERLKSQSKLRRNTRGQRKPYQVT